MEVRCFVASHEFYGWRGCPPLALSPRAENLNCLKRDVRPAKYFRQIRALHKHHPPPSAYAIDNDRRIKLEQNHTLAFSRYGRHAPTRISVVGAIDPLL